MDGARNIIFDARSNARRTLIAVVGLRDSILVQTDDAPCSRTRASRRKSKSWLSDSPKTRN